MNLWSRVVLTVYLVTSVCTITTRYRDRQNSLDGTVTYYSKSPYSQTVMHQAYKIEEARNQKSSFSPSYSYHTRLQSFAPKYQDEVNTPSYPQQEYIYYTKPDPTVHPGSSLEDILNRDYNNYDYNKYDLERTQFFCLVLGICANAVPSSPSASKPLSSVFEWKQLEFDYPNDDARQKDLDSGYWIPEAVAPIDVDVHYGSNKKYRVFVSIPRFQVASPVTLGQVTTKKINGNPVITPYPSWSWHENPSQCKKNRLVSVYRVKADECGRLWVLDTGKYGGDRQTCDAQLIAFDLNTNEPVHRFTIPTDLLESRSILVTPTVDIRGDCAKTYVYIADCQTYSIIVYDVTTGRSWRVSDKTMYPYPNYGTFKIQGDQFDLMDGILGMALEPYVPGRDRKLFYHAMSSPTENWVYTSDIRNESRFHVDPLSSPEIFHTFNTRRSSQSCAIAIDRNGVAYFGLMSDTTFNCWNTASSEYGKYISPIHRDPVTLQFISGVKVINNKEGSQEVWMMTSRFQKIATGTLNTSDLNFRIHAAKIPSVLEGTSCKYRDGFSGNNGNVGGYGSGGGYGLKHTSKNLNIDPDMIVTS